jgi:hypothetical protein
VRDLVYIVLLPVYDENYIPVPYTKDKRLAYKYVRDHYLNPDTLIEMEDDDFERYEIESPYHLFDIDNFQGLAMIWDEVEEVSNAMDDLTYDASQNLMSLAEDLKYFKGKDIEEVRKAIQKLIKNLKREAPQATTPYTLSVALLDRIKHRKYSKAYFKKYAIENCAALGEDELDE